MKINRLGLGILCALLLPSGLSAAPLSQGLLYYLPFNGDINPVFAKGFAKNKFASPSFVTGKQGQALSIPAASPPFMILSRNNFDRRAGTLAFWVDVAWKPSDKRLQINPLIVDEHFQLVYDTSRERLYFMTGKMIPENGFHWDYGVQSPEVRQWNPGEWHHIAVTWDSSLGTKALYVDGKLVSQDKTPYMHDDLDYPEMHLKLEAGPDAVTYDELIIWDRVLGAGEINQLYADPAGTARQLEQIAAQAPPPPVVETAPLEWELTAQAEPAQLIIEPGQPITAHLPVTNQTTAEFHQVVRFNLDDFWEKTVATQDLEIDLKPGEKKTLDVSFTPTTRGVFKIGVDYNINGRNFSRDVFSFAAWPLPKPQPDSENSFFGSHIESFSDSTVDLAARLGETWNRDHNMLQTTWWARQQPEPGAFNSIAEKMLDRNKKYNIHVLGQLFGVPYWASPAGQKFPYQAPGFGYPYPGPPDLDAFRQYVLHVVGAYKDYIHDWEIWNEPEVSIFWRGSPGQFADMAKVAYQAAKEANPNCTVLLGGFTTPAWRWHEQAAQAGAFKYADAISIHLGDPDVSTSPEQDDADVKKVIDHFEDLAVKYGPGKKMPIWSTEGGIGSTTWLRGLDYDFLPPPDQRPPMNWHQAAIRTVQGEVILQANDIVKHFFYFQHTVGTTTQEVYTNTSLMELTRAPKPLWIARVNLAEQVAGCTYQSAIRRTEGRVWINLYRNAATGEVVVVAWAGDNGVVELGAPYAGTPLHQYDIMGNEVKPPDGAFSIGEPCYFRSSDALEKIQSYFQTVPLTVIHPADPLPEATTASLQPQIPSLPDYVAVREAPNRDFPVDLKSYANMGLADDTANDGKGGWADQGPLNDARDLETGRKTFYGVPVEIADPAANGGKSILVLRGKVLTPGFPSHIDGIPVGNGKDLIRALYFLHSSAWAGKAPIAKYVIHFASGKSLDVPIQPGVNIADWWQGYQPDEESRPIPFLSKQNQTSKPQWRYLRLWEWQNPTPEDPIVSFDFVSAETDVTPILLAVTALKVP